MNSFDYIIIGGGAAGLNLAIKMAEDAYFLDKQILILEKEAKNTDDRTWSFWEKDKGALDEVVTHQWTKGAFHTARKKTELPIAPYHYKTIRSSDFYNYAKKRFAIANNITWIQDEVIQIKQDRVICANGEYHANHIFDSRVPDSFHEQKDRYSSLIQHFKGWFIRTKKNTFNPDEFIMMDYRLKWEDQTSFTYVLPFSDDYALIEFTLFNHKMLTDAEYEEMLSTYIQDYLKLDQYEIKENEQGVIPMSDYPFHHHHTQWVTKIGTAGGWVRPSSGYSFRNCIKYSEKVIANIKSGKEPSKGIAKGRFRAYDAMFLDVLKNHNDLGESVFTTLYTQHPIERIFRFLDEESSLVEDLQVMNSLNLPAFRQAFFRQAFKK